MPTTVADLRHGRRGGGWLPAGYVALDEQVAEHCAVCDGLLTAGQIGRHATCVETPDELFPNV